MITTIRQLRSSTKEILSTVSRGDSVVVTNRGKPCAKIIPVSSERKLEDDDMLFGIWKDRKEIASVKNYLRELRKGRYAR